ncbi:hypothetical protein CCR75_004399 [Bremia lactucae]|uniref:C-CAP/cofactor C-like domain-containing protein n=1 Tax=Bremia lactucae TaxID=4779 RepID=A0A976FMS7_BRELC|nr:hypothetical protein CCR75_004399 [Bremia lactucae]
MNPLPLDRLTSATTEKATGGQDLFEFISAPPAKKRRRRDKMLRIWLRLELFELGLVPLPSKYAASVTLHNVKKALDAVHKNLQVVPSTDAAAMKDNMMLDTDHSYTETDNLKLITFPVWKEAVELVLQWREQDYKAFWLLLAQFHRMIPVDNNGGDLSGPHDGKYCLEHEEIPVYKMAIFLFIQTVKPYSWKYSLESFNTVWYREPAENMATTVTMETSKTMATPKSPILHGSPLLRGSASPPPSQSPHTVGMADRSTADSYYLAFVREKLDDLFGLLYPSVELTDESSTSIRNDQMDLLGFLLCWGDQTLVDQHLKLSSCYTKWKVSEFAINDSKIGQEGVFHVENGAKLGRFFKIHLTLNEKLYPPVGCSKNAALMNGFNVAPPAFSLNDDFSLETSDEMPGKQEESTGLPVILSQLIKTTVIKRAEDFFVSKDSNQFPDTVVFSCQDSTNVTITACKNCRIITAPNVGILLLERCENVQITSLSGLIRVSNCLDTRLNVYTLSPIIVSGETLGVVLGPYNTNYPGLKQQLKTLPFLYHVDLQGSWNQFLDLDTEKDDFSLETSGERPGKQDESTGLPVILSQLIKTTVIKRAEDFFVSKDSGQFPDTVTRISTSWDLNDILLTSMIDTTTLLNTNVTITACKNCRIITAPNVGILLLERCENVQITSLSGLIRVSNCLDTRLNVYTLSPIIVSGETLGVVLGPYNTNYPGLKQQLKTLPFLYHVDLQGSWNQFLDLDTEKDTPCVSLQVPETFNDVCIPVKGATGVNCMERPFPIPSEYNAVLQNHYETVEKLRQLVTSDEFDLTKKRTMEVVIQYKFKEWLSSTSNVRQILDLVHLDRTLHDPPTTK